MVILFRLLIIIAFIVIIYSAIKYITNPKRKFELAHEKKQFHFHDEKQNVRKNFFVTYKGVLFEGEKYLGTTDKAFEVISAQVWVKNPELLQGLDREDFEVIEKEILIHYPNAEIEWKSPVKEFLKKKGE
ncbi:MULTISPECIES: sigma-w pathway protein ysdB [Alkalihalobacterium]|uniref:Sigma-w pathway protein ysdB n=1 Tax=Alkalihalobacterium chitinilyticum TaxID=2980103 RepID=A0ABT5VA82_9BACI|nr:sigma-w pathway protein ysdB [Alkalihalobacterium chitinilyticum]MDE5412359.1 sigma-w pathway protein ysdB [Alkalihalobacterium chitinilyticum]MEB1807738.1 sigma-w pathway protein ysdB [Bacillaceae bacterium]